MTIPLWRTDVRTRFIWSLNYFGVNFLLFFIIFASSSKKLFVFNMKKVIEIKYVANGKKSVILIFVMFNLN